METDRNGLEVLDRDECLALVAKRAFGRIGLSSHALPTILPVNYWSDGTSIYIRTSAGSKLEAAARGDVVVFEVDDSDGLSHAGWSVVVTGIARVVDDPDELAALQRATVPRWVQGWDGHIMAISTEMVRGRRLRSVLAAR
jgi:nitroimidazol reductase NimA-like FMN-containing flavoprotein (pyridoxamine 5'-phosphate oxidase superfamily)